MKTEVKTIRLHNSRVSQMLVQPQSREEHRLAGDKADLDDFDMDAS